MADGDEPDALSLAELMMLRPESVLRPPKPLWWFRRLKLRSRGRDAES